jgi:hypothetical protein
MGAKRVLTKSAMALAVGAMCAGAVLPGVAAAKGPKAGAEDTSRRVCKNVTPTGSRMPTRVCRTQAQWDETRDKTQDGVLQFQMKEQTTYSQVPG